MPTVNKEDINNGKNMSAIKCHKVQKSVVTELPV